MYARTIYNVSCLVSNCFFCFLFVFGDYLNRFYSIFYLQTHNDKSQGIDNTIIGFEEYCLFVYFYFFYDFSKAGKKR